MKDTDRFIELITHSAMGWQYLMEEFEGNDDAALDFQLENNIETCDGCGWLCVDGEQGEFYGDAFFCHECKNDEE